MYPHNYTLRTNLLQLITVCYTYTFSKHFKHINNYNYSEVYIYIGLGFRAIDWVDSISIRMKYRFNNHVMYDVFYMTCVLGLAS